ncbi:TetR/AcrR family transcriptional regulator [Flavobacterium silvaticum]|uniref:TetR/AcrR family transcriptional regulator n=1 Tax=Flavobacterium silvaticum TaxID=1852020 RepID=A0A972FM83_9FLAO|nr:TetR/AcrR family transcriptional regulator [Flavobacterium silvaticum]NMH27805.1 TetR/AcrR family transcriptional regulator [Flavobacterium silvaticum]
MRQRDERKEKAVIDKAIELIVSDGVEGFSMNKLAKACGISVATLYIYYKDKEDLVRHLGTEMSRQFFESSLNGFEPEMSFREGLWTQWQNRMNFTLENPQHTACFEILRQTMHRSDMLDNSNMAVFKDKMRRFTQNAIDRKEIPELPIEVYWSIAYGPLYTLLRFQSEGQSMGGKPYKLTREDIKTTFETVIKALTP